MNGRARVEAALALERPDRPPASAWGHTYKEEWSPEDLSRVTVERARRYGWDFVKFQPRAGCFAEAFGSVYRPSGHGLRAPLLETAAVAGLEGWKRLAVINPKALDDQVKSIGLTAKELGPDVPVIQTVFSPISVAGYLVGKNSRRAMRELKAHPELVGPALDRVAEALIDFARRSVESGAAGIFYAVSGYGSANLVKREIYEELLLPYDQRVLGALPPAAWFNVLHLCGGRLNFDLARQIPAQVISWSVHNQGNPSLREGREMVGRPVMGGLGQRSTLLYGNPERVAREVGEAIAQTDGRGLLVAPGCSVPASARAANLKAITDALAA